MTPLQVQDAVLETIGEREAVFHTRDNVRTFVHHAEQLLGMTRALTEKTVAVPLAYNQKLYTLTTIASDFVYPLRVTLLKRQLFPTTLARIVDTDPDWQLRVGEPKKFFILGTNRLGVYPTAPSDTLTCRLTYIARPTIPNDNESFWVPPEWHEILSLYAAAVLLAKEQLYEPASLHMQAFLTALGLKRDGRFGLPENFGSKMVPPLHPTVEPQRG